ncbi:MAG TPA: hypothetical protein VGF39_03985 [Stellaceae bacterium]|jgi:hypothetical protein
MTIEAIYRLARNGRGSSWDSIQAFPPQDQLVRQVAIKINQDFSRVRAKTRYQPID